METNIKSLPGVSELLRQSLVFYKTNFKILAGIGLLPALFGVILSSFTEISNKGVLFFLLLIILSICSWIIQIIIPIATTKAIFDIEKGENHKDIKNVYNYATSLFFPALWIGVLSMATVFGGMIFLIVPGIILSIYLAFASISLVVDDRRGLKALSSSLYYSKGNFWGIVWRMICLGVLAMLASICLFVICLVIVALSKASIDPVIVFNAISTSGMGVFLNHLLSFVQVCVFYPILMLYSYFIYKNLKLLKPEPNPEVDFKKSNKWFKVLSIISIVSIVLMFLSTIFFSLIVALSKMPSEREINGRFNQAPFEESITE